MKPLVLVLCALTAVACNHVDGLVGTVGFARIRALNDVGTKQVSLAIGETAQLRAYTYTAAGDSMVSASTPTWLSRTPGVATVDAFGRVVALSSGASVIHLSVSTYEDSITVVVR